MVERIKVIKKVHVWHFGKNNPALLFFALETIGQRLDNYSCEFCKLATPHYLGGVAENRYVVCSECGEASKLVE